MLGVGTWSIRSNQRSSGRRDESWSATGHASWPPVPLASGVRQLCVKGSGCGRQGVSTQSQPRGDVLSAVLVCGVTTGT